MLANFIYFNIFFLFKAARFCFLHIKVLKSMLCVEIEYSASNLEV